MSGTVDPWAEFVTAPARTTRDPWADFVSAPAPQPKAPPRMPLQIADDAVRQVAKGTTFGFADELAAGANAAVGGFAGQPGTFSERYTANLAAERERDKAFEAANPKTAMALQIGGSLLNPVARFMPGGTLPIQMVKNAIVGGAAGAATGFGEGEGGFMSRILPAISGAATGAVVGAGIPPLATALAKGARTLGGYMGLNNARTDAQRQLINALAADTAAGGDDLTALAQRLAQASPDQPMILPDVTLPGGQTQGLAQAVSREPGAGRAVAARTVEARGGLNQSARLSDAIERGISSGDWKSTVDDLLATRKRTAGPLYDAVRADQTPVNVQPIIADIDARIQTAKGSIREGLQRAKALLLNNDGSIDTTLGGLHETKIALDALMERGGEKPIDKFARMEVREVQQRLLAAMDAASGGKYAAARDAFAGPSRARDAMDLGRSLLQGRDFDETADAIAKLSASEKDFFRIGVARALDDAVKGRMDTADLTKMRQLWGSQAVRERIASAFDDPRAFDDFAGYMDREMTMAQTNQIINPRAGSPTSPMQAQREQPAPMGPMVSAGVSALRGDTLGAIANALRSTDIMRPQFTMRADELAPMLFSMRAGDRARVINELMARQTTKEAREALARALSGAVLRGGTMTGVQIQD